MRPSGEPPRDLADRVIREALQHPANLRAFLRQAVPTLADAFDCERGRFLPPQFPLDEPPLQLSPVLPLVLYTGAGPWQNNRTLHDLLGEPAEFHGFVPQWGPLFWELSQHSTDELLQSGDAWQQVLAVLRAQAEEAPVFERVYVEAMRRLEELAAQNHVRWYDLMRIILTWGLWRRPRDERQALLAAAQAVQVNVERQKEIGLMGQTIAESIWEEGWLKGEEAGRLKGEEAGRLKGEEAGARRVLQRVLSARFGPLPEDVVRRIEACTDLARLTAAAEQVLGLEAPEDLQL